MEFTPEEIKEFQGIIKAEYGVELSETDALLTAKRLMSRYELTAKLKFGVIYGMSAPACREQES